MASKIKQLLGAFKNLDQIAEGLSNNVFKKEHVEAVATDRFQVCVSCSLFDAFGKDCLAPGTQPCCSDCGCSLAFKVRSLSSECPKGFWKAYVDEETEIKINQQIEENAQ
jgi:hypothetical protein|tara:strand:- start:1540 stop:1869 length:330 start_codon:yes stop_codon:yes gene_type:complete